MGTQTISAGLFSTVSMSFFVVARFIRGTVKRTHHSYLTSFSPHPFRAKLVCTRLTFMGAQKKPLNGQNYCSATFFPPETRILAQRKYQKYSRAHTHTATTRIQPSISCRTDFNSVLNYQIFFCLQPQRRNVTCVARLLRRGTKLHDHLGGCAYLSFPQPPEYLALTIQFVSVVVLFGRSLFYSGRIVRRHGETQRNCLLLQRCLFANCFRWRSCLARTRGPYAARADTLFTNVCV